MSVPGLTCASITTLALFLTLEISTPKPAFANYSQEKCDQLTQKYEALKALEVSTAENLEKELRDNCPSFSAPQKPAQPTSPVQPTTEPSAPGEGAAPAGGSSAAPPPPTTLPPQPPDGTGPVAPAGGPTPPQNPPPEQAPLPGGQSLDDMQKELTKLWEATFDKQERERLMPLPDDKLTEELKKKLKTLPPEDDSQRNWGTIWAAFLAKKRELDKKIDAVAAKETLDIFLGAGQKDGKEPSGDKKKPAKIKKPSQPPPPEPAANLPVSAWSELDENSSSIDNYPYGVELYKSSLEIALRTAGDKDKTAILDEIKKAKEFIDKNKAREIDRAGAVKKFYKDRSDLDKAEQAAVTTEYNDKAMDSVPADKKPSHAIHEQFEALLLKSKADDDAYYASAPKSFPCLQFPYLALWLEKSLVKAIPAGAKGFVDSNWVYNNMHDQVGSVTESPTDCTWTVKSLSSEKSFTKTTKNNHGRCLLWLHALGQGAGAGGNESETDTLTLDAGRYALTLKSRWNWSVQQDQKAAENHVEAQAGFDFEVGDTSESAP